MVAVYFNRKPWQLLVNRRCLLLVIRWLQLTTITIKATVHLTPIQRDFSDSSRECGARGQPPVSAQVSGCAGGSGVSEALALPQSPPCNPDPRERARERGRGLPEPRPRTSQAHSTGSPAPARPRELARGGISNARDWAPRVAGVAGEARGLVSRPGGLGRAGGPAAWWADGHALLCYFPHRS